MTGSPLDGSVADLGRAYRSGVTTPSAVVAESLDRIAGVGADLGAVADVMGDAAGEATRRTEELLHGHDRGPLHGVPVVVKELIDVAGRPRRAGTHVRPAGWEKPVERDAPAVARLREAGAMIVARGRTHEFAWGITSRHPDGTGVVNPLDRTRIAGGSSGGVAALVAAGCAPLGIGTDTGGSVRIPAAFCGLVGWKPAIGRLSTKGIVPLAPTFDTVGVIARTVDDVLTADAALGAGLAAGALSAAGADDLLSSVVVLVDAALPSTSIEMAAAIAAAVERAGVTMRLVAGESGIPPAAGLVVTYGVLQRSEALHVHRDLLGCWPGQADAYGADVAGRLREAEALDPTAVLAAGRNRSEAQARFDAVGVGGVDVILLPTVAGPPPSISSPDEATIDGVPTPLREAVMPFTIPANVTGWPALTVPLPTVDVSQVPPSIQLMARPGREHLLPAVAARLTG